MQNFLWLLLCLVGLVSTSSGVLAADRAASVPDAFAVVLIDGETEKRLGPFPYDRAVTARGIERLAELGAKGVVLKFFIDRPKSVEGDAALARAMEKMKVILQARLDDAEKEPNEPPARFRLQLGEGAINNALSGKSGWIPLPALSERAYDLGFIDSTGWRQVPMVEAYQGHYYKSLYTAALELAMDTKATVVPGKSVSFAGKTLRLDRLSQVPVTLPEKDDLQYVPYHELLEGTVPAEVVKGKVVILGYDGASMPANETTIGKVKGHRLFCYQLFSLYRALK